MNYLVTTNDDTPFFTNSFEPENNFNVNTGMVVFDLINEKYTTDGVQWQVISKDRF